MNYSTKEPTIRRLMEVKNDSRERFHSESSGTELKLVRQQKAIKN